MEPNPLSQALANAEQLLICLFKKQNPLSVVLSGPPGIGKSYIVRQLFERYKMPWRPIRPSAKGFVERLYLHEFALRRRARINIAFDDAYEAAKRVNRGEGKPTPSVAAFIAGLPERIGLKSVEDIDPRPWPLVFDDFDFVFEDATMLGHLKVVLDDKEKRVISNDVRGHNYIEQFEIRSPVIFLTNRDLRNPDDFPKPVWKNDIPAIQDRSTLWPLPTDPAVILDYTLSLAPTILNDLKERDPRGYDRFLSKADKAELVAHFRENKERYYEVSPRTLAKLGRLRLSIADPLLWQAIREGQLKPVGTRPVEAKKKSTLSQRMNDARWNPTMQNLATPPEFFAVLKAEFHIIVDVCAEDWNAKCPIYFTPEMDGLAQDWGARPCFMNPPYGNEKVMELWVRKAYESSLAGATVVCLLPARLNSKWWNNYVHGKAELRPIPRRLFFTAQDGRKYQIFADTVLLIYRPPSVALPNAIAA